MRKVMAETAEALAYDVTRLVAAADAVVSGALTFDLVDALLVPDGSGRRGVSPLKPHVYTVFAPVWPSAGGDSVALGLLPTARLGSTSRGAASRGGSRSTCSGPPGISSVREEACPDKDFGTTPLLLCGRRRSSVRAVSSCRPPRTGRRRCARPASGSATCRRGRRSRPTWRSSSPTGHPRCTSGSGRCRRRTRSTSCAGSPRCSARSACVGSSARDSPASRSTGWGRRCHRACSASAGPRTTCSCRGARRSSTTAGRARLLRPARRGAPGGRPARRRPALLGQAHGRPRGGRPSGRTQGPDAGATAGRARARAVPGSPAHGIRPR